MLISIVMPAYNTEKFIAEAIESVISQTYQNWELIIINDGSPDSAAEIAKEFTQKDARIKIINQVNQGVAVARNTGIKNCTGKYIGFLDSDDFYLPNYLKEMVSRIKETNCDAVYCGYIDEKLKTLNGAPYAEGNILECYALKKQHIWINTFIIKSDLLKQHDLWFTPDRRVCQDQEFILKCGVYTNTKAVAKPLCFYRHNQNSVTNTLKGEKVKHDLEARKAILAYITQHFYSPYKQQVLNFIQLTCDTNLYNYQRDLWKTIIKDKKFDDAINDLKNFGSIISYNHRNDFKNTFKKFVINSKNKSLWRLISLFRKQESSY